MSTQTLPVVTGKFGDLSGIDEAKLSAAVQRHCPIVRFHQLEKAFPMPVERYMANARLCDMEGKNAQPISASYDLNSVKVPDDNVAVSPYDMNTVKAGDTPVNGKLSTPIYVHLSRANGFINVTYHMFFAMNGTQTVRYMWTYFAIDQMAYHEGDWETVNIRFKEDDLDNVYAYAMFHHGDAAWFKASDKPDIEMQDGRLVVYVALNGHGLHPHAEKYNVASPLVEKLLKMIGVEPLDRCEVLPSGSDGADQPQVEWNPAQAIVVCCAEPLSEPNWVNYKGRWGIISENFIKTVEIQSPSSGHAWLLRGVMKAASLVSQGFDLGQEGWGPQTPWHSGTQGRCDETEWDETTSSSRELPEFSVPSKKAAPASRGVCSTFCSTRAVSLYFGTAVLAAVAYKSPAVREQASSLLTAAMER